VEPGRRVFAWPHNLELIGGLRRGCTGLRSFHRAVAGVVGGNSRDWFGTRLGTSTLGYGVCLQHFSEIFWGKGFPYSGPLMHSLMHSALLEPRELVPSAILRSFWDERASGSPKRVDGEISIKCSGQKRALMRHGSPCSRVTSPTSKVCVFRAFR
jgi:hypothetical protein